MSLLTPAHIHALAAAACAAPSADNKHVIRIETSTESLRLLATPEFQSAQASRRVLGLISTGAVAENLILRARRLGLRLEPTWHPGNSSDPVLAHFSCHSAPAVEDALDRAIETRHTNRRIRFIGPTLPPAAQDQLFSECSEIAGTHLIWLDEPERRRRALQLIRWAEAERFRNQELHREMFDSIRFDVGWRGTATEGLLPGSLELPAVERPAFSLLRHWKVQRAANLLGTHRFIGFRAADLPCRLAPHLCAISADGDLEPSALNAGRLLQRVWLRATVLGMSFQVFAASAIYALDSSTAIPTELRRRLASGWKELEPLGKPLVVFRMGHAKAASLCAGRPSPQSLLTATSKAVDQCSKDDGAAV